jgi:hypothetical protein
MARSAGERAGHSAHEAIRLLERLLLAAEEGGRAGHVEPGDSPAPTTQTW